MTPLNTAMPTMRRALSRSPSATGSSDDSADRKNSKARTLKSSLARDLSDTHALRLPVISCAVGSP